MPELVKVKVLQDHHNDYGKHRHKKAGSSYSLPATPAGLLARQELVEMAGDLVEVPADGQTSRQD